MVPSIELDCRGYEPQVRHVAKPSIAEALFSYRRAHRVTGLPIDKFARKMIDRSTAELADELAAAQSSDTRNGGSILHEQVFRHAPGNRIY